MSDTEVDDIAARALGAMILEATALAVANGGEKAAEAMTTLCADSGLVLEACAAILYATSFVAGVGDVPAVDLYAAALAWQPDPDEMEAPAEAVPAAGDQIMAAPVDAVVSVVIEPLTPADSGRPCMYCPNSAVGRVGNVRVCFMHTDMDESDGAASEPPFSDDNQNRSEEEG